MLVMIQRAVHREKRGQVLKKESPMRRSGICKALFFVLSGGLLLQATGGCQQTLAPIISDIASSLILNIILGGLGGIAT